MAFRPIDFAGLAAALLARAPDLVARWLPAGVERNARWYVGDFDGSAGESANVNLSTGQWIDNAAPDEDKGGDLISLYARIHNLNQRQAALALMDEMGWRHADDGAPQRQQRPPAAKALQVDHDQAEAKPAAPDRWRPIVPVPAHAPAPDFVWRYKDRVADVWTEHRPSATWAYWFEGALYGHVARFDRVSSSTGELLKDTLPLTWCEDTTDGRGGSRWHWKTWPTPRPLFVPAQRLEPDPTRKPVLIVEGEKCAEAAARLLGDLFDVVSWPGGCKTWALASWGWLMGRTVYLWADCDAARQRLTKAERLADLDPATKALLPAHKQPGLQAMVGIATDLARNQGCVCHLVPIPEPGSVAAGWDIANAIAEGWDAARLHDHIRSASAFVPADEPGEGKSTRSDAGADPGAKPEPRPTDKRREIPDAWQDLLLRGPKGGILAVRENIAMALDGWPAEGVPGIAATAGLIVFNQFTNNVEKSRETPWGSPAGQWLEHDELAMGQWLVMAHAMPPMARGPLEEAILMVAHRNAYHPLREQMQALRGKWDNTRRLGTWLQRCVLADPQQAAPGPTDPDLEAYHARVGTWVLMAMVARVLELRQVNGVQVCGPGVKYDYMLILEGPQGWGKSTLAAVLGGAYFADTGLSIGDKDSFQNIQGVWAYEWGELENMTRQEVTKVKLFISSPKDRFRATFDKRPRDYPRQVVFIGTTNESNYLTDTTGNRRFWPVRITREPDIQWLRDNREQLLAEAVAYVDADQRFYPTRDEQRRLFEPQQQARKVENAIEAGIRTYLYDEHQKVPHMGQNGTLVDEIGLVELLQRCGYELDKQTDAVVKRAGSIMHALGWTVRRTSDAGRPRVYCRPPRVDEPPPARPATPVALKPASASDGSTTDGPTQGHPSNRITDDCPF